MQDFRNVEVWKKAHQLSLRVHGATKLIPKEEIFGITMMLRRSAINIPSRIAEGCSRIEAEFAVDLRRAIAATAELEYLVLLAKDLDYWNEAMAEDFTAATIEIRKMIYGLLRTLR